MAGSPTRGVLGIVRAMAVDRVTAEVVGALARSGVEPILLKGPAIAQWLYPEGGRSYGDTDLLVGPHHFGAAEAALVQLGFQPSPRRRAARHAWVYHRLGPDRPPSVVDLHRTLPYVRASPERVWETLSAGTMETTVAGTTVAVLSWPGRAFHIALHAAQHGVAVPKPLEDLRRAILTVELTQWQQAVSLARRLEAEDCLAAGLRLLPEGQALAATLGLTEDIRVALQVASRSETGGFVLDQLARPGSARNFVLVLLDLLVPRPSVLRRTSGLARHGAVGLGLATIGRLLRLVRRLPLARRTWRQAREQR